MCFASEACSNQQQGKARRCFTSLHVRLDSPWPPGFSINIYAWGNDPTGRHVLCLVPLSNQMSDWSMMCISIQWADGGNYTFYWTATAMNLWTQGLSKITFPVSLFGSSHNNTDVNETHRTFTYLWFVHMTQVWLTFWVQGLHWCCRAGTRPWCQV